uniref:Uncharacterized protein n=1 Tax=Candidatus Kentrum sp. TC TaxID=2126339 RepID=A0A450ZED6_9GAMM|nr:MAG: hypothetical protein BECKTC1821D_GA0114238_11543 [Candidatus Kentron sp. TC]
MNGFDVPEPDFQIAFYYRPREIRSAYLIDSFTY